MRGRPLPSQAHLSASPRQRKARLGRKPTAQAQEAENATANHEFEVDAADKLTGAATLSLGGQIIPRTYSGTVSLKSNCTCSSRSTVNTGLPGLTVNRSGVTVDGGNEIQFMQT